VVTSKLEWISSGQITKGKLLRTRINLELNHDFFGVTFEYKEKLHAQIFDFLYRSKGGFTYTDVYKMPISIRTMYMNRLAKYIEEEIEEMKKAKKKKRG